MAESAISVKNLTKTFKHGFKAVDDISFEVEKGSIFAFLGPNGAGKTTTIKMLTTLLHPTSGTITLNGLDPVKHPHAVRESFGIVFQDHCWTTSLRPMRTCIFTPVSTACHGRRRRRR